MNRTYPKVLLRGRTFHEALANLDPDKPVRVHDGPKFILEGKPRVILASIAPPPMPADVGRTLNGTSNRRVFRPRFLVRHLDALYHAIDYTLGKAPPAPPKLIEDLLDAQDAMTEEIRDQSAPTQMKRRSVLGPKTSARRKRGDGA